VTSVAVHGTVVGHVQGVGFRYALRREATQLGVAGWVRNRANGTVEFFAQGDAAAIDALMRWTAMGPRGAQVRRFTHTPAEPLSDLEEFEIHPTQI